MRTLVTFWVLFMITLIVVVCLLAALFRQPLLLPAAIVPAVGVLPKFASRIVDYYFIK
jgi:hypothetical protein